MQATCSLCGGQEKVLAYGSINTAEDPDLKAKVKDGSLFVWECPHCGGYNLARYQTLYHDPDQKLMVWLMPEGNMPPEQLAAVQQHMEIIAEQAFDGEDGYTLRRVGDIGSLMEKVNIFDANLDDRVIEMCKYVTKMELAEGEKDPSRAAAILDTPFKFFKLEGADGDITLSFPQDGQMQGIHIGFNVYEDCRGILQRNPSVTVAKGFAKVDADWLGQYFR